MWAWIARLKALNFHIPNYVVGQYRDQVSSEAYPLIRFRTEVSLGSMDPGTMVLTMPMSFGRNVDDEGFPELPQSPWLETNYGLNSVLARVVE